MPIGTIGKYERLEILGHGASGIVYLAWDTLLRRNVALKEIRAAGPEQEKVLSEARVLDRLRHPNIIAVHSVDLVEGAILLDMELVRGKNLAEVLRARLGEPFPPAEAVRIVGAVLEALAFAHERRILHKDIKPANILIGESGVVKLTDFGLAEALGTASVAGGGGTYPYMAPEDFSENAASDYRSDLWAVGVVLYELLTGKRPFVASDTRNPFAWKSAIETTVVPPTGVSTALDTVLAKALAKAKEERFAHARAFAEALTAAAQGLPPAPTTQPVAPAPAEEVPTTVFVFLDGTEARTLDALLLGAAKNWDESRHALLEGRFSRFLRAIGEPYIADLAAELAGRADRGPDRKLREFLERARPDEPPQEDAEHTLPFGALKERLARELTPLGAGVAQQQQERPEATAPAPPVVAEQVRWWYFPTLLASGLPAAAGGQGGHLTQGLSLTGLVSAMLLLVSIGSNQPVWTRILCLFPVVLGVLAGGILASQTINGSPTPERLFLVSVTALLPLGVLLIQAATARRLWRLWLTLLLLVTLLATFALANLR